MLIHTYTLVSFVVVLYAECESKSQQTHTQTVLLLYTVFLIIPSFIHNQAHFPSKQFLI